MRSILLQREGALREPSAIHSRSPVGPGVADGLVNGQLDDYLGVSQEPRGNGGGRARPVGLQPAGGGGGELGKAERSRANAWAGSRTTRLTPGRARSC